MISFLISKLIQLFSKRGKQLDVHTKPIDSLQAESLESRILYSAAPVEAPVPEAPSESAPEAAEVVPAAAEAPPAAAEAPAPEAAPEAEVAPLPTGETEVSAEQGVTLIDLESASATASTEIVFISSEVFDHQSLAANVTDGPEIIILDGTRDGVSQIAEALAGRTGIDAVHLFTHGSTGSLELGTATLDSASMVGEYADELSVIQGALSADADLLIYGCDFSAGETGLAAASLLSEILDADVAASSDHTGAQSKGGDWDLETVLGAVEAATLKAEPWQGLLAPGAITVADDLGTDDVPQDSSDLTALTVDYTNRASGFLTVSVQLDPTANSGGDTSNIAAIFDTNNDGNADYGFAISLSGDPFALSEFTLVYGKGNSFPNKVSGKTTDLGHWVSGTGWDGAALLTDLPTVDTTAQDPFDASNDTLVTLTINLNDIVNHDPTISFADIKFINTTTQPSHSVTSAPKDLGINAVGPFLASDDSATTDQGTPVVIDVSANDSPALSPGSVELGTGPSNGTVTIGANGLMTYTPTGTFSGNDSFTYLIYGLDGDAREATVNVTVNPVIGANNPPVAGDSTITVDEESTDTALGLTAPTDADGDTLTITVSGLPSVGTVTLADGTAVTNGMTLTATELAGLEFDAPADLLATTVTSFTYTVDDGTAAPVTGTTSITVNPINDAPVADDSTITVDEESTDTSLGLTAPTDVDGPAATITVSGLPSVGTVTLADGTPVTNGMVLTEAQLTGLEFDAPADLLATTVTSFTYTVDDGVAPAVTGTTSITVDPINDAPVADDSTIIVDEESTDTPLGLTAPTDVDGPAATITVTGLPSVGTVTLADGTPVTNGMPLTAAQLAGLLFDAPADLLATTLTTFTYTVDDGVAPPVTGTTSITVNPINSLKISDVSADESGVLTFTVTLEDAVAGSFTVDLAAVSGTATSGLDFLASQTLTFAGTAGETQTFTVTPNDDGIIEIDETFSVVMSGVTNTDVIITDTGLGTILDNDARPAGVGVTTDIELVANGSGGFDLVIEDVETNSPIGFASEVPVADSADDLFIERVGDNYVIRDEGELALGSPIIGAIRTADNEIIVPVAMVTGDIIFRTGIEDDTVTVGDLGATLAGGLFIDTEDPANRFNDFDVIDYNSNTAMAAGSDAVFRAETINALESARLEAGAAGTVFWDAGRNISMAAGSVVASADGDITYEANLAGQFTDNFVAVHLKDADITSTAGNVDIDGRAGDTGNYNRGALLEFGSAIRAGGQVTIDGTGGGGGLYGTGVAVNGSMVESTGAGPVRITGTGGDGTLFNEGISIQNWSAIDAGSGDLILDGTGGSSGHYNRGINAGASSFSSSGGDITVDGTGGGSGLYSMGARFTVSDITTNGNGTITMRGTGAGGTLANMGLQVSSGSTVSTVDGAILLEGTGDGSSLLNHGVQVTKSTVSASGAGTVTVIGTGGVGTIQNQGVEIGGSIVAVNDGKLTITGTGLGTVINNKGVNVFDSTLSSSGVADIEVTGTGSSAASSSQNVGAYFGLRTIITASGTGNVTLTGTGGTGSIQNHGVILETNASVTLASGNLVVSGTGGGTGSSSLGVGINAGSNLTVGGSGTATITGIGANGTMLNNGVRISSFSSVQVANGDLTITGTARGSTSLNDGIKLSHGVLTATGAGNIVITGTGSQTAAGIYNTGINMLGGSITTASGNLTMTGLGGSGTTLNQSIRMSSAMLKSTGGDISVIGTSNGATSGLVNTGVYMMGVQLDGSGIIGITGIGGGGTMLNHGVYMGAITVMGSEPTCIGVAGGGSFSEDEDGDFLH